MVTLLLKDFELYYVNATGKNKEVRTNQPTNRSFPHYHPLFSYLRFCRLFFFFMWQASLPLKFSLCMHVHLFIPPAREIYIRIFTAAYRAAAAAAAAVAAVYRRHRARQSDSTRE